MAHTMSPIAATDSRAIRAIAGRRHPPGARRVAVGSAPCCGFLLRDIAQERNARQVRPDVVVQVGGDARSHVNHLEQPRQSVVVQAVNRQDQRGSREAQNHQRSQMETGS